MDQNDFSKPIAPYKADPDVTAIYGKSSAPPIVPPAQSAAPVANTGLTVNVSRPRLAANTTTASDASPVAAGTVAPTIQPPAGVRAARAVRGAVDTGLDVVGGANDIAGIPGKAVAGAASAAGNFASDFGKEYFGAGGPPALAVPAQQSAAPVTPPVQGPAPTGSTDLNAPGVISEQNTKVGVPALLGGDGIMNKPLTRASAPNFTTPALMTPMTAPTMQSNGPLPSLKAEQGQNVFDAMVTLGKDMAAYRGNAAVNSQAQQNFKSLLEASKYNMDALSKITKVNSEISDDQRKDFEQQLKSRTAEAVRQLALGPKSATNPNGYDPAQQSGLRILAGMEKTQDQYKFHEVLLPKVPGHEMEPQEKVSVLENIKTGQIVPFTLPGQQGKTVSKADFKTMAKQFGGDETKARKHIESQGYRVE